MFEASRSLARIVTLAVIALVMSNLAVAQSSPAPQASPLTRITAPMLVAKLESTLNTKSAKVGDPVTAKTVKDLKLNDLNIPKGSKLIGSIAAVTSQKDGDGTSALAIKFDQVQLKSGSVLRTQGQIVGIAPTPQSGGLGYDSVLGRGGVGSTPGLDPTTGAYRERDNEDIPLGSAVDGVAVGMHLNASGATELRGAHRDIKLDSSIMIKVALFRGA
jgi:hypothetical protein